MLGFSTGGERSGKHQISEKGGGGGADSDERGVKHLGKNMKIPCLSQLVTSAPGERAEQLAGAVVKIRI